MEREKYITDLGSQRVMDIYIYIYKKRETLFGIFPCFEDAIGYESLSI